MMVVPPTMGGMLQPVMLMQEFWKGRWVGVPHRPWPSRMTPAPPQREDCVKQALAVNRGRGGRSSSTSRGSRKKTVGDGSGNSGDWGGGGG